MWIQNKFNKCLVWGLMPRNSVKVRVIRPQGWVGHLRCDTEGNLWGCSLLVNSPFSRTLPWVMCTLTQQALWVVPGPSWGQGYPPPWSPFPASPLMSWANYISRVTFPDLWQTTFYLIPGVYLVHKGCQYDLETKQTHKGRTNSASPGGLNEPQLHGPWGSTN